ncbi:hypothetical protein INS49_015113 [Diaporthe citri]|uniref:uncharacterized protein n=1 Tax=Diaporthe citri TaxID=83186 RepID=UPI001C81A144|nr:uncharacterized protein INS49_015113 [Diaporthe citri]KAG6357235.1 hypothetical protein INS49_015113 [Diaporthe citri]
MAQCETISFDITPEKDASKLQFLRRQFSGGPPALLRSDFDLSDKTAILLNAGVNRGSFALNPTTGHEEDIQTNYLSTALLVFLILEIFQKSRALGTDTMYVPGRIVVVSSDRAAWAKFDEKKEEPLLPPFDVEATWDKLDRYGTSKLLGQDFLLPSWLSGFLHHWPSSTAPTRASAAARGSPESWVRSLLSSDAYLAGRLLWGARTLVHAAVKQDERSHGQYVEDWRAETVSHLFLLIAPLVYATGREQLFQRLWNETMDELSFAGVQGILEGVIRV